jgi:hypothetical protein
MNRLAQLGKVRVKEQMTVEGSAQKVISSTLQSSVITPTLSKEPLWSGLGPQFLVVEVEILIAMVVLLPLVLVLVSEELKLVRLVERLQLRET